MKKEEVHINEEFLDQSWANMSDILDKEMPVKRSKKRAFWIWLSGLAALVLLGITYANAPNSGHLNAFPINTKTPIKKVENQVKIANNQFVELKKEDPQYFSISSKKKSSDTPIVTKTVKNLTFTSPSESTTSASDSEAGILNKKINTPTILNNNAAKIMSPISNRKTLPNFNPLDKANIDFLAIKSQPITFPTYSTKNRGNWRLGVYSGILYPKLGSFSTGFYLQKKLINRWSLYLGLGYGQRKRTLNANQSGNNLDAVESFPPPTTEDDDMSTSISTIPDPNNNGMSSTSDPQFDLTTSISLQKFHYIEFPVLVQYKLNNRWSLELGGQLSRLFGINYRNNDIEESAYSSDVNLFSNAFDTRSASAALNYRKLTSWEIAALGGINYQLSPKLQVYSSYHFGLNNYLTSTDTETNNQKWRQIELGVRYYFK